MPSTRLTRPTTRHAVRLLQAHTCIGKYSGTTIPGMAFLENYKVKFVATEKPDSFFDFLLKSGEIYGIPVTLLMFVAEVYCSVQALKLSK